MEEKLSNYPYALLESLKPEYLGPCDAFSIPPRNGCQAITAIEATPVGQPVVGMRRESGPTARQPLCRKHYAVWVN